MDELDRVDVFEWITTELRFSAKFSTSQSSAS